AKNRQRLSVAQEQLSSGKRINRPSDDPVGAGAVLRLRTSQNIVKQYQESVGTVKDRLLVADGALDSYEQWLDRARSTLTQGASDLTSTAGRAVAATEIDSLRAQILSVSNLRSDEQYVFGGTRQDVPPFDPATNAPAATATTVPLVQLEPDGTPVAVGVTADTVFSDANGTIFQTLTDVAAALRGTGNAAADKATISAGLDRLGDFSELSSIARTHLGTNINSTEAASDRLSQASLSYESSLESVEGTDFVATALDLTNSENALNASLQASAHAGRRSLIDFLG
ncbi:MAG TPA: hypothetical protein VEV81_09165, partial [Pyrinomonadaceae bacterium]|nr:hypothetical protein [Pyrinomonadaceae bacterium]